MIHGDRNVDILCVMRGKQEYKSMGMQEVVSLLSMVCDDVVGMFTYEIHQYEKRRSNGEPDEVQRWVVGQLDEKILERPYFIRLKMRECEVHKLQFVIDRSCMVRTFLRLFGAGKDIEDIVKQCESDFEFKKEADSEKSVYFLVTGEYRSLK